MGPATGLSQKRPIAFAPNAGHPDPCPIKVLSKARNKEERTLDIGGNNPSTHTVTHDQIILASRIPSSKARMACVANSCKRSSIVKEPWYKWLDTHEKRKRVVNECLSSPQFDKRTSYMKKQLANNIQLVP